MFEEVDTQAEWLHNVPPFILQQVLVPLLTLVSGLFVAAPFDPTGYDPVLKWPYSSVYALPALVGLPLAYLVNKRWQGSSRSGRWIWILPCLAWAYDVFLVGTRLPLSARLANQFAPSGATEGLPLAFVTIPTLACVLYSIGMVAMAKRRGGIK
jgi:hypothetical protein